jgi:hypothetical protein
MTVAATLETCEDPSGLFVRYGATPYRRIRFCGNIFFFLEAVLRVGCYIPLRDVYRDPFIWVDVLTPVPFLVSWMMGGTYAERALPVMDAWASIRLLKLSRYTEATALLGQAVRAAERSCHRRCATPPQDSHVHCVVARPSMPCSSPPLTLTAHVHGH